MQEFSWSQSQVYGALTLGLLVSSFAGLPIGRAIDKGWGRLVMMLGSLLAGVLLLMGSQLDSLFGFYLVFVGVGALQSATLYDAAFSVIASSHNKADTKQLITQLTLWAGFASTVFIPLIEVILKYSDWRSVLQFLGVINILVCTRLYARLPQQVLVNLSASTALSDNLVSQNTHLTVTVEHESVKWALKQPIFWLLLAAFSFFAAVTTAFKFHFYPLLLEKGLNIHDVVILLAILGPAQVFARLLLKWFGEQISVLSLGYISALVLFVFFVVLAFLPTHFLLLLPFIILFGAATGTMTIIKGVAVSELLSQRHYGVINGAMNVPIKIVTALSPLAAAMIWLFGQSYGYLLQILIVLSLLTTVCFVMVIKRYSKECHSQK